MILALISIVILLLFELNNLNYLLFKKFININNLKLY
jgi:hypothetical protein